MPRLTRPKTDIFQDTTGFDTFTRIHYFRVVEHKPSKKISLIDLGVLDIDKKTGERIWRGRFGSELYGIFQISWWKGQEVSGGEGNLIGGRVIKNRIPPSHFGRSAPWGEHALLECYLPDIV